MKFGEGRLGKVHVIHIDRDEDLLESIKEYIAMKGIKNGVILTGFGTLDRARLHAINTVGLPPYDEFVTLEGPIEVTSIDGIIANGVVHAHYEMSNREGSFGGHLEPGCRTLYLNDVVLAEIEGMDMQFEVEPETNLRLLAIKSGSKTEGPAVEKDEKGEFKVVGRNIGWKRNK